MVIVQSKNEVAIRLTRERWTHIVERHPEMDGQRQRVLETVSDPEMIQQGDFEEYLAIRFYNETPLTSKFLVVVYKEIARTDGFILTAYYSGKPSERRRTLWKR